MHRTDDTAAGLRTLALGALLLAACGGGSKGTDPPPGGSLAVTVTGLPGGTAGRVTVTGPGGFTRNLGATTQFDGLPAGTYQVSAVRGTEVRADATVTESTATPAWNSRSRTAGRAPLAPLATTKTRTIASRPAIIGTAPSARWVLWMTCVPAIERFTVGAGDPA